MNKHGYSSKELKCELEYLKWCKTAQYGEAEFETEFKKFADNSEFGRISGE